MNPLIETELENLWAEFDKVDVEEKIEALARLKAAAKREDVPRLVEALKSEKSDFWIRELLSEPICQIGRSEYLPELFDAFARNYADGHDNDGFAHWLTEIAWAEPQACRTKLEELLRSDNPKHQEYAAWLMEFCK